MDLGGRPRTVIIDETKVRELRVRRFTWSYIAIELGYNYKTLLRWKNDSNFVEPFISLDNENPEDIHFLDNLISGHSEGNPNVGEAMTAGFLRTTELNITRQQMRDSLRRVDPEGIAERSIKKIVRRQYRVEGPHHLWHIDTYHKLIRYGLVIAGCIDGDSRTIIYLFCSDNNRSLTSLRYFIFGVQKYQLPSRVRGDRGGENVLISEFMISHQGTERGSYIAGSSKHNTRIERLWRDVKDQVTGYYRGLFNYFETQGMDITNLCHIFVLQYLFINRINQHLQQFMHSWNNHKISTENNKSPNQILYERGNTIPPPIDIDEVEYAEINQPLYNEEENNEIPLVEVEPLECPLSEENILIFEQTISPLTMVDKTEDLFQLYMNALQFFNTLL